MSVEEHLYRLLRPPSPPTEEQLSEIEKWYSYVYLTQPISPQTDDYRHVERIFQIIPDVREIL